MMGASHSSLQEKASQLHFEALRTTASTSAAKTTALTMAWPGH